MNTRSQLVCIHLAIPFVLLAAGAFVVTGWLPPPPPDLSFADTVALYDSPLRIRLGASCMAAGSALYVPIAVAISCQLRRIEGARPVYTHVQMLSAAVGTVALQFPAYFWLALAYHDTLSPDVVTVLHNWSFFVVIGAYSPAVIQFFAIGICIISAGPDRPQPYPRWFGYTNLWLAVTLMPGATIPFFLAGPLTYHGVIGFWVVFTGFFLWVILTWWFTVRAIHQERTEDRIESEAA